jgi:hypothetical protein
MFVLIASNGVRYVCCQYACMHVSAIMNEAWLIPGGCGTTPVLPNYMYAYIFLHTTSYQCLAR